MTELIREIAFDTETTGLNPDQGDRIIEIGAVEMINHIPTGRTFRRLVNPGVPVSEATRRITGITDDDLSDKPGFEHPEIVGAFLEFVGDAVLVAHNAAFDRSFLNMELKKCGRPTIPEERWVDTVAIAKKRFPGAPASLDALCRRFEISLESRTFHGALLDSQLLAAVYLELRGGRVRSFSFEAVQEQGEITRQPARQRSTPLPALITAEERVAHSLFISQLGEAAVWNRLAQAPGGA